MVGKFSRHLVLLNSDLSIHRITLKIYINFTFKSKYKQAKTADQEHSKQRNYTVGDQHTISFAIT